jgi:hypothetical protein
MNATPCITFMHFVLSANEFHLSWKDILLAFHYLIAIAVIDWQCFSRKYRHCSVSLRQDVKEALQLKVLEITNCLLSFILHRLQRKLLFQQLLICCLFIRFRGNIIKPLASKDTMGILNRHED